MLLAGRQKLPLSNVFMSFGQGVPACSILARGKNVLVGCEAVFQLAGRHDAALFVVKARG